MKVELLDYTKNAERLLIFVKNTRLKMNVDSFLEIDNLTEQGKSEHIKRIFSTIESCWEFVDYTFLITELSCAAARQLLRTRVGVSFAQESQRVTDQSAFDYYSNDSHNNSTAYHTTMNMIRESYKILIDSEMSREDARGILPMNAFTTVVMKINLTAIHHMMLKRFCLRTQGEYRTLAEKIYTLITSVHPWAGSVMKTYCEYYDGWCPYKYYDCIRKEKK